ncbi:MAG: hypothetical protein HFH47_03595, partial [Bacilli bacterium]|nr:hypothetical protein [Bacilli bacterium]
VKVTFKDVNINKMEPSTSKLTVTLDFSQADGSGSVGPTPVFQTVYTYSNDILSIGNSIDGIKTYLNSSELIAESNKKYYLKHEIDSENKIVNSYVCFITDSEHCMQGGNSDYYETNKALMQSQEEWFTNNEGSCEFKTKSTDCYGAGFFEVGASDNGSTYAGDQAAAGCEVSYNGTSACNVK